MALSRHEADLAIETLQKDLAGARASAALILGADGRFEQNARTLAEQLTALERRPADLVAITVGEPLTGSVAPRVTALAVNSTPDNPAGVLLRYTPTGDVARTITDAAWGAGCQ